MKSQDIYISDDKDDLSEELKTTFFNAVNDAIEQLDKIRSVEGKNLKKRGDRKREFPPGVKGVELGIPGYGNIVFWCVSGSPNPVESVAFTYGGLVRKKACQRWVHFQNPRALNCCPVRLVRPRTPGFHPGKRGSNPLRDASFLNGSK